MSRTPDAGTPRTERIEVRATEAERAEIDAACAAAGRTRSDVLRELGLEWARSK